MIKSIIILDKYNTSEKLEYFKIKDSKDLSDQARVCHLVRVLLQQARTVLDGKCPHERSHVGYGMVKHEARDWMVYYKEQAIMGKCKFYGE